MLHVNQTTHSCFYLTGLINGAHVIPLSSTNIVDPPPARTCPLQRAPGCWLFPLRRWWSVPSSTAWWREGWTSRRSWCSLGSPPRSKRWCGWSGTLVYLSDTQMSSLTLWLKLLHSWCVWRQWHPIKCLNQKVRLDQMIRAIKASCWSLTPKCLQRQSKCTSLTRSGRSLPC